MKQTLLITLFSIAMSSFSIASSDEIIDKITDKIAAVVTPAFSSDTCSGIDEKLMKLDAFTTMVNNTSAFHLEEKASALTVPGITASNNKKKMLRDAEKKRAELSAERQKHGCETPIPVTTAQTADKVAVAIKPALSSDSCDAINRKLMKLDAFTTMVNNTSAFHLEEKASAILVPGITASNNKKKMLRDAEKKRAELLAEHQTYDCKNTINTDLIKVADVATVSSNVSSVLDNEPVKSDESMAKVSSSNVVAVEESAAVVPVSQSISKNDSEQLVKPVEKQEKKVTAERQSPNVEISVIRDTAQVDDKMTVLQNTTFSSEKCYALDEDLIELSVFTNMVKNTSAFHLEEKASALPSPGFTVSNNKKKMLRDIEKRYEELLTERQKYGCEPL